MQPVTFKATYVSAIGKRFLCACGIETSTTMLQFVDSGGVNIVSSETPISDNFEGM